MKTLIYSFLDVSPDTPESADDLLAMYDLWWRHWRGPGRYTGDLLVFTNHPGLERPGVQIRPLDTASNEQRHFFYRRVQHYHAIPHTEYDVILQTDLDVLAINEVTPLFRLSAPFHAAASGLKLFDPRHAGNLRCFPFDAWRRYLPGRRRQQGVSASVFACAGTEWIRCMSRWAALVNRHQHKPLSFQDQTLLNLAYARQTFPIRSYPSAYIRHQNWTQHPDAILWHFPTLNRLEVMRQHQRL